MQKKSFTLVELTISITILAILVTTAMATFTNIVRSRERISKENMLYNEARLTMLSLSSSISDNVVDYSEYFNRKVLAGDFGDNYDAYYTRFLNPGDHCDVDLSTGANDLDDYINGNTDLGKCCYDSSTGSYYSGDICASGDYDQVADGDDFSKGINPYNENESEASAFCSNQTGSFLACKDVDNLYKNTEMYMISDDGRKKLLFGREYIKDKGIYTLSYVTMDGTDSDNDGIIDRWECSSGFDCTAKDTVKPDPSDLDATVHNESKYEDYFQDFVPISSSNINITKLEFYISPIEDPLLGYGEEGVDHYPIVTVILEAKLSDTQGLVNPDLNIILQTTITPKYEKVKSYSE